MRHKLLVFVVFVGLGAAVGRAIEPTKPQGAQAPSQGEPAPPVERAKVDKKQILPSLMVMSSRGYTYRDGKLTLEGISPTTITFADRPHRLAGSVPTETFVADWSKGRDSFEKVPPNADFSTFHEKGVHNAVVELKNPVLKGDALTYDVRILKGELPEKGGESSLFIDIIGMPWTPMSFAGVARRSAARAAYWGVPPVAYVPPPGYIAPGPHVAVW